MRMRTLGEAITLNSLKGEEDLVNKLSDAEQIITRAEAK